MKKEWWVPALIGLIMIAGFYLASFRLRAVLLFIPGVILTYLLYLLTAFKKVPEPEKILPLYLLALGVQLLHFAEEFITDFYMVVPEILDLPPMPLNDWVLFNMGAYFLFILGGIILFRKQKVFMIIPLFFIVVGVILNTIGHLLLSLRAGGYAPGLYTILFYLILGPMLIKDLVRA